MATLMDTVKQNTQNQANTAPGQSPFAAPSQLGQLQSLVTAKGGKDLGPSSTPKQSNLQEQVAQNQARLQQRQEQVQANVEASQFGQQVEQQKQAEEQDIKSTDSQRLNMVEQHQQSVNNTIQEWQQKQGQLDFDKERARIEQVGQQLRLNSDKYVNQIQTEGAKARLDSGIAFEEALNRAMWADEGSLLSHDMELNSLINAKGRDFREQLADLDLDTAMNLALAESKQASQAMVWSGAGSLVTAGVGALAGQASAAKAKELQDQTDLDALEGDM